MKPNTALALATVYKLFPALRGNLKVGTDTEDNAMEMLTLADLGALRQQPGNPWLRYRRLSQQPSTACGRADAKPFSVTGGTAA